MKTRKLHPIVAAWDGDWQAGMRGRHSAPQYAAAREASQVVKRRHQIVSAVFTEVERLGGLAVEKDDGALAVRANGVLVEFSIVERLRMVRLPLSSFDVQFKTAAAQRGYRSGFGATGRLVFKLESYVPELKKGTWEEGKDGEDLALVTDRLAVSLIASSEFEAKRALMRADDDRRAAAELERRALAREAKERDERRWADFGRAAVALRNYRDIEQLIYELEGSKADDLAEGIAWARRKLAESHPVQSAATILRSSS